MYAKRLFVASALLSASLVAQAGWNLSGWNNDLYAYVELPAVTLKVAQFWYRVDFNQPAFVHDAFGIPHGGVRKAVYLLVAACPHGPAVDLADYFYDADGHVLLSGSEQLGKLIQMPPGSIAEQSIQTACR